MGNKGIHINVFGPPLFIQHPYSYDGESAFSHHAHEKLESCLGIMCVCFTHIQIFHYALLQEKYSGELIKDQEEEASKLVWKWKNVGILFIVNVGSSESGLSMAAKLGIGVGGGAALLMIIILLAFAILQKQRAEKANEHRNPFGMQSIPFILQ